MIALIVILTILLLILILPVGADVSYLDGAFALKAKAGPLRIQILPKKEKQPKEQKEKDKPKEKEPKAGAKEKPKQKMTLEDYLELAKIGLGALGRFRRSLSIDTFLLHVVSGAADPYGAVMQYGYLNAGLSALAPAFHRAFKVRREDVRTAVDLELGTTVFEAQLVLSIQIWEILTIGFCAGFAFLRWYLRRKREAKRQAKLTAQNA